jgi:hypothetical protein
MKPLQLSIAGFIFYTVEDSDASLGYETGTILGYRRDDEGVVNKDEPIVAKTHREAKSIALLMIARDAENKSSSENKQKTPVKETETIGIPERLPDDWNSRKARVSAAVNSGIKRT